MSLVAKLLRFVGSCAVKAGRQSEERIPPSRYIKIGTVSLPLSSRYIGLNFPVLRRNWLTQLHFHFSYQSATGLHQCNKIFRICSGSLLNLINSSLVNGPLVPQISLKIHPSLCERCRKQTKADRQARVKTFLSSSP